MEAKETRPAVVKCRFCDFTHPPWAKWSRLREHVLQFHLEEYDNLTAQLDNVMPEDIERVDDART